VTTVQISNARKQTTKARGSTMVVAALLCSTVAGLALALAMPRGPMSSAQSLVALGLGMGVGVLAGWLMSSRWAALLAPAAFGAAFELARIGAVGPTVDGIRLDGLYGILALIVGRGFDVLVIALPMVVGGFWGAALARREGHRQSPTPGTTRATIASSTFWRAGRGTSLVAATVIVVALGALLARPASTSPILGADGDPLPGSIAELTAVRIGGHDQSIMLRGRDVPNLGVPVFLVEGEHEAPGRAVLARQWFAQLSAPTKQMVTFESSGHTPHLHEPGRFATYLADVVLAQTYPN
jgi:proline iminopeptidase